MKDDRLQFGKFPQKGTSKILARNLSLFLITVLHKLKKKRSNLKKKNLQDWFGVLSQTADTTGYITSARWKIIKKAFPLFCLRRFLILLRHVFIVSIKKKKSPLNILQWLTKLLLKYDRNNFLTLSVSKMHQTHCYYFYYFLYYFIYLFFYILHFATVDNYG